MDAVKNFFSALWGLIRDAIVDWFSLHGETLLAVALVLIIGFGISALITRALRAVIRRSKIDKGIRTFLCSCVKVVLNTLVVLVAAGTLGINIYSILTVLGAAGITLGLALKDTIANFAAGLQILFNHLFKAGDFIEVSDSSGKVQGVDLMYTTIRTPDHKQVEIPNAVIASGKLINYTARTERRVELSFLAAYDADVETAKAIISKVAAENPYTNQDMEITVGVISFTKTAAVINLWCWVDANDYWKAHYSIQENVIAAFKKYGVAPGA